MSFFHRSSRQRRRTLRVLGALAVVGLLLATGLQPGTQNFVASGYHALLSHDPAVTHAWVSRFGSWGPLVLLAAFVVQAVLPVLPALILVLVSLLAYGPVTGFFIVYLGTLLGAAAGYGLGDPLIRALAGERHRDRAHAFATEQGLRGVLLIRLMPVLSSDLMNLVAGATRMPFGRFLAATALGALPVTLFITLLARATAGSPARLGLGLALLSLVVGLAALIRWLLLRRARPRPAVLAVTVVNVAAPEVATAGSSLPAPPSSETAHPPLELRPPDTERTAG